MSEAKHTTLMNIEDVRNYLPHRYPFLLVDRVVELNLGESIVAYKNLTINEPYFDGHFPDQPVFPGVLLVEAMAVLQLDDRSARIEVTVYADTYNLHRELLVKDAIVIVEGSLAYDDYSGGLAMRAKEVRSLVGARQTYARELVIELNGEMLDQSFNEQLASMLEAASGGTCPVSVLYRQANNQARVKLGERWQVFPSDELLQSLRDVCGAERVSLAYT